MRASSWEMIRPTSSACGERNAARSSRKIWGKLFVQLGVITGELNRAWYQRSSGSLVKDVTEACTPSRAPMDGRYRGRDRRTDRRGILKRSSCCLGPSPKRRPKSTWLNCSIACGPLPRDQRCCRLLPAVASRSRSRLTPIAPSAPSSYGRAKALKARRVRRGPFPVRDRSSRPKLEAVRIVDMGASNLWAELAATNLRTRSAHNEHELAKAGLKKLQAPGDAKEPPSCKIALGSISETPSSASRLFCKQFD